MENLRSMNQLVNEAEDLLAKLGKSANPEVRQLRDKVEASIEDMKGVLGNQAQVGMDKIREATKSVVEYVQENPWIAVASATAVAVALLYMAFSGRDERDS
jgi:ElaB/YqjD/DUF883 family membrane-anchored ribosome-binding protein